MENGFYHPDRGYWQTTGDVPQRILDGYPKGTVEVPLKPSGLHEWDGANWVEVAPDPTTLATAARSKRNGLLSQSDWTQVADAPVDQAAWATYRQALRDITIQAGFPENIDWPVAPE
jgi:hypothetical protein